MMILFYKTWKRNSIDILRQLKLDPTSGNWARTKLDIVFWSSYFPESVRSFAVVAIRHHTRGRAPVKKPAGDVVQSRRPQWLGRRFIGENCPVNVAAVTAERRLWMDDNDWLHRPTGDGHARTHQLSLSVSVCPSLWFFSYMWRVLSLG